MRADEVKASSNQRTLRGLTLPTCITFAVRVIAIEAWKSEPRQLSQNRRRGVLLQCHATPSIMPSGNSSSRPSNANVGLRGTHNNNVVTHSCVSCALIHNGPACRPCPSLMMVSFENLVTHGPCDHQKRVYAVKREAAPVSIALLASSQFLRCVCRFSTCSSFRTISPGVQF